MEVRVRVGVRVRVRARVRVRVRVRARVRGRVRPGVERLVHEGLPRHVRGALELVVDEELRSHRDAALSK